MTVTIFHNPKCSKSRATMALLTQRGITPRVVEYLNGEVTAEMLSDILDMLGLPPRDLMRKGESEYKDNGLADETLSRAALIQAMVDHPRLIERPIVLAQGKAALGRPPENILKIL